MRRVLWAAVMAGVVASGAAEGAAPARRTASVPYVTAAGVQDVIAGGTYVNGEPYGVAILESRRGETRLDLQLVDEAGLPVAAEVYQGETEHSRGVLIAEFCGSAEGLRVVRPGKPVMVYPVVGGCTGGVSVPTRGVVTATFLRR